MRDACRWQIKNGANNDETTLDFFLLKDSKYNYIGGGVCSLGFLGRQVVQLVRLEKTRWVGRR